MSDTELFDKLQSLVEKKCWKLTFNHDRDDGYFCTVDIMYSFLTDEVADLADNTKRKTLRDSVIAAIEYLENPPKRRIRM